MPILIHKTNDELDLVKGYPLSVRLSNNACVVVAGSKIGELDRQRRQTLGRIGVERGGQESQLEIEDDVTAYVSRDLLDEQKPGARKVRFYIGGYGGYWLELAEPWRGGEAPEMKAILINRHGVTLATAMPDTRALVIRDGLVIKEENKPEIYVYQDGQFRWISSLEAFERRGFTWEQVHIVESGFLTDYPIGPPIYVLLKCNASPHIYRLEEGKKRWIIDIETFEAERHVWEDVHLTSCGYLRGLPDGKTIPPGHGPPPQP
ncbi:MAG TPA: hypothetical protein ENN19_13645 [Chloroflexi bacterium]|nr:hypothetical protein [Chloroflexota bacterium]